MKYKEEATPVPAECGVGPCTTRNKEFTAGAESHKDESAHSATGGGHNAVPKEGYNASYRNF